VLEKSVLETAPDRQPHIHRRVDFLIGHGEIAGRRFQPDSAKFLIGTAQEKIDLLRGASLLHQCALIAIGLAHLSDQKSQRHDHRYAADEAAECCKVG